MTEENISQEFRLNNIYQTRTSFTEKINQNELISKKHKTVFNTCNTVIL